ncbi:MAG: hypothetical protein WCO06_05565 [Candidatus Roizmanbacteria bacterium]
MNHLAQEVTNNVLRSKVMREYIPQAEDESLYLLVPRKEPLKISCTTYAFFAFVMLIMFSGWMGAFFTTLIYFEDIQHKILNIQPGTIFSSSNGLLLSVIPVLFLYLILVFGIVSSFIRTFFPTQAIYFSLIQMLGRERKGKSKEEYEVFSHNFLLRIDMDKVRQKESSGNQKIMPIVFGVLLMLLFLGLTTYTKIDKNGIYENGFFQLSELRVLDWKDVTNAELSSSLKWSSKQHEYDFRPSFILKKTNKEEYQLWDSVGMGSMSGANLKQIIDILAEHTINLEVAPLPYESLQVIQKYNDTIRKDVPEVFEYANLHQGAQ